MNRNMDTQKLIMYLVQCRKDDFIDCFEHLTNTFRRHLNISMYGYPLFTIAASLKTLLDEEYSSEVFRKAKENMTGRKYYESTHFCGIFSKHIIEMFHYFINNQATCTSMFFTPKKQKWL
jgi:hypothetical protein